MRKRIRELLAKCTGFEWDEGNKRENWLKHGVKAQEAEEVFINQPQVVFYDTKHSQKEERFTILGVTSAGRRLTVVFTVSNNKIRVITARDQKRGRERQKFEARKEAISHA
jgi:uncharacterized DUF497 family protein